MNICRSSTGSEEKIFAKGDDNELHPLSWKDEPFHGALPRRSRRLSPVVPHDTGLGLQPVRRSVLRGARSERNPDRRRQLGQADPAAIGACLTHPGLRSRETRTSSSPPSSSSAGGALPIPRRPPANPDGGRRLAVAVPGQAGLELPAERRLARRPRVLPRLRANWF